MPISLEEQRTPGAPVVKRTAIGQHFVGALVNVQQRDIMKRDERTNVLGPIPKGDGKNRQELVLTLVTMPGTTAPAGLGDYDAVPQPGEKVRLILRGQAFAEWIQVKRDHGPLETGDVVTQTTDHGQVYDANKKPTGPKLTTQAQVDAVPRGTVVGVYGPISLRKPTPAEAEWVEKADAAYHGEKLAATSTTVLDDEEPLLVAPDRVVARVLERVEMSGWNTYVCPKGHRRCRECARIVKAEWSARRRRAA